MKRRYYSLYGPYIVKFIALKNGLGYKYRDAGNALALLDSLAAEEDIAEVPITKELVDRYIGRRPNESDWLEESFRTPACCQPRWNSPQRWRQTRRWRSVP